MRTKRIPQNAIHRLQDQAKRLIDRIFRFLPCVVCLSMGRRGERIHRTVPCHILNKGMYNHLRYIVMNQLPMCDEHHTKGKDISMHAWGGDTSVIRNFTAWLKNTLPRHYEFYIKEKNDRAPHRLSLGDISDICEELQFLKDNPVAAEKLIYES